MKAYRALGSLRDGAPFRPWLLRIVANETRNLHRSAGRRLNRERRADDRRAAFPAVHGTADPAELAISQQEQDHCGTSC